MNTYKAMNMFGFNKQKSEGGSSRNPLMKSIERESNKRDMTTILDAELAGVSEGSMSATGTIVKTFILTLLMLITAAYSYVYPNPILMWGGIIGGIIMVVVASMKPRQAVWAAPAYALFEGLFVGAISAMYASFYEGIIFQAVSLTVAVLLSMLLLYQTGAIKVTAKLRAGVMMATMGVFVVYLASMALGFFGINVPYLHEGGPIGIGISLVIIGIASFNLLLDFDNIETGVARGLPSRYEWVFGMGLLVTLVWIYIEILRLLSMLNRD